MVYGRSRGDRVGRMAIVNGGGVFLLLVLEIDYVRAVRRVGGVFTGSGRIHGGDDGMNNLNESSYGRMGMG